MIPFKTGYAQVTATTAALSLRDLLAVANSNVPIDFSKLPVPIDHIEIDPEGAIRYTIDGSAPTATTGLQGSNTTGIVVFEGVTLDNFRIYGSNIKVNVQVGTTGKMP